MVKGISKQVIVVHSQDRTLFDQAIFILSDQAIRKEGITDAMLLREADRLARNAVPTRKRSLLWKIGYFISGAILSTLMWLVMNRI